MKLTMNPRPITQGVAQSGQESLAWNPVVVGSNPTALTIAALAQWQSCGFVTRRSDVRFIGAAPEVVRVRHRPVKSVASLEINPMKTAIEVAIKLLAEKIKGNINAADALDAWQKFKQGRL